MNREGRQFWDASVIMTAAAQAWHSAAAITSPYDGNPLDLTLFVFCHNNESSIITALDTVVEAMRAVDLSYEIVVIDDSSRDRSVELMRRYIEMHPRLNLVLRINKYSKGLPQNYTDAAFIGRGTYYRLVTGDNIEPTEAMADVLKAIREADIIVPYYIASMQETAGRQLLGLSYTWLINLLTGNRINDYHSSQVHLRFNVMRWHGDFGAGFQVGLLCRLLDLGFTYKQVPCRTTRRRRLTWKELVFLPPVLAEAAWRRLCAGKIRG